ncbi:helix-turn-helix domain-containing protein [Rhodoferax sp. WC2427]|uniref:helix-turn-helix domain-containing protein n=1 Tax=Rhodoferax sp. WC2427 TaxID=3234144 RepID=UPI0034651F3B
MPSLPALRSTASLVAPSWGLSACVRATLFRSTLGVELSPTERLNHFPSSPLCCLSWMVQGETELLARGDEVLAAPQRVHRMAFFGPHTVPTVTRQSGPASGLMLMLLPDALHALTGIDIAAHVNRHSPMHRVLDADWCRMAQAVLDAPNDPARLRLIEDFLLPRWQAARRGGAVPARCADDWVQALGVRALASGMGQSLRQAERRIRAWTGQSLRGLRGRARAESAFFQAREAMDLGLPNWAAIAAESGYADQSHFCRESRRVTGLSPTELRRRMDEDESYWVYRVWS